MINEILSMWTGWYLTALVSISITYAFIARTVYLRPYSFLAYDILLLWSLAVATGISLDAIQK